jgi:hypothetical protein
MDDHGIRLDTERIVQKLTLEFRPDDGQTGTYSRPGVGFWELGGFRCGLPISAELAILAARRRTRPQVSAFGDHFPRKVEPTIAPAK